jgi:hypothetical protein
LTDVAERLRTAVHDDPGKRRWASQQDRDRCRQQQQECEQMHLELLAIEAQCETELESSRQAIEQRLDRVEAGRRAATSYSDSTARPPSGGQLDLSSD